MVARKKDERRSFAFYYRFIVQPLHFFAWPLLAPPSHYENPVAGADRHNQAKTVCQYNNIGGEGGLGFNDLLTLGTTSQSCRTGSYRTMWRKLIYTCVPSTKYLPQLQLRSINRYMY